jgi:microcystin degradation protein MlrC
MRIAIGEFSLETNTFRAGTTPVEAFQRYWEHGDEIIQGHRGVRDSLGGMIDAAERLGIEVIPTFATTTQPSATIAREAYEQIRDELLTGIRNAGKIDALCLSLHGAGVAEGIDDIEGTLLGEIREVVGPDLPILVTLDLHGNQTQAMVDQATVLLNCHLYPHTDMYERGIEAVELAQLVVEGAIRPVTHMETLPMMIPPSTTMLSPAKDINELCWEWESGPGVIDVSFVHGFPHTDIPNMVLTVVATTDNDPALAERAAKAVADAIWKRREEFLVTLPEAEEAIQQALATDAQPVVIAEVSDNPGGGSPGDGTRLLRALLEVNPERTCFGFIYDPEVARQAHEAGTSATIDIRLGAKTDTLHGEPIETQAYVKCLTDGQFVYTTPMGAGDRVNLGPMARLVIGNVDVLVSSVRTQTLDAEVFLLHGIDIARYKIVALKSQQHFRAGFAHLAGEIIRCDTPGSTPANLSLLPFERVNRPIWPLDSVQRCAMSDKFRVPSSKFQVSD